MTIDSQSLSIERRPIGARAWRVSVRVSAWMARRGVSPNAISVMGMVCGVGAGGALALAGTTALNRDALFVVAAALVQMRLVCNMLDGMVAIERRSLDQAAGRPPRKRGGIGELFNELPDRVSDAATLIGLGYAAGIAGTLPTLGWLAALLAVATAYVRAALVVAGAPQDYCGPMAKPHRMAIVTAVCLASAVVHRSWEDQLIAAGLWIIIAGSALTIARRLVRGVRAIRSAPLSPGDTR